MDVGPLDADALHQVVRAQLEVILPRALLREVREASGGNPLYALEIVRTMQRGDVAPTPVSHCPVPESLHDLVHGRLLALPRDSRDFLLAAASHAHPTIATAEAASGVDRKEGLEPAIEARVVELRGSRIRFTHPLLAAGAYETADRERRMEVHARLAKLVDDPEARAWQLAASVDRPDETVAAALQEASRHARDRGALRPAALMLDRASELTPANRADHALRRAVDAAYLHFESGDSRRAEAQLREVIAPLEPGQERARAMVVLARIRLYEEPSEAAELFAQVVEDAGDDRETLAFAHEGLAASCMWLFERFEDVLRHAGVALALAEEMGDEALTADIVVSRLSAEVLLGQRHGSGDDGAGCGAAGLRSRPTHDRPATRRARRVLDVDRLSMNERAQLSSISSNTRTTWATRTLDRGCRFMLGDAERLLGNLAVALELSRDGERRPNSRDNTSSPSTLRAAGSYEAQRGDPEQARDAAGERSNTRATTTGASRAEALGHVALLLGAPEDVVDAPGAAVFAFVRRENIVEPGAARFAIDLVEALRRARTARRSRRDPRLVRRQRTSTRPRFCAGRLPPLPRPPRCAVRRPRHRARRLRRGACVACPARHPTRPRPDAACPGRNAAPREARREARGTLEQALAVFDGIGAALWAERARGELRRISGRAPTSGALTPAEERVAALVAEGRTNREVAAALFVSDRTVEGHLSRIFGKLGVRHRTELARALAARQ